jgi:hypothetical protein
VTVRRIRRLALVCWHCWPVYLVRYYVRVAWDGLPGPWPVKLALIILCQLIPGGFDEVALIAVVRVYRGWRARKQLATEVAR